MNCERVKNLLSEFADERLDASTAWQVQTHLSDCAACGKVRRDMDSVRRLIQTLPARQPSARFDDALAQRLALTRRPAAPAGTWQSKVKVLFSRPFAPTVLRPALALGLVLAAGTVAAFLPIRSTPPATVSSPALRSADPMFVSDCVAQHHRDAAAEPLADLSAQTLAGSLDSAANPSADSGQSADSSQPADSSLF